MRAILEAVYSKKIKGIKNIIVISNKPDATGLIIAQKEFGVKTVTIANKQKIDFENEIISILKINEFGISDTLICLAGFMRIIGSLLVNRFQNRIINIHPSLLPSFRGLHAQKQALEAGVKVSGCTVHYVDTGVDSGPILLQKCVPVHYDDTEESLSSRILVAEHEAYVSAIQLITTNKVKVMGNKVVEL